MASRRYFKLLTYINIIFYTHNDTFKCNVLFSEYSLNECIKTLEYKYERHYYPYTANEDVHQTFLTVHWKPIKKQSCISITYFHNLDSDMEIIMNIFNENGTIITSPILEKLVSTIISA